METRDRLAPPAQEIPLRTELSRQEHDIARIHELTMRLVDRLEPVLAQSLPTPKVDRIEPAGRSCGASPLLNSLHQNRARLCELADSIQNVLERLEV